MLVGKTSAQNTLETCLMAPKIQFQKLSNFCQAVLMDMDVNI